MTVGALLEYMRPFYPAWDRALESNSSASSICRWTAS